MTKTCFSLIFLVDIFARQLDLWRAFLFVHGMAKQPFAYPLHFVFYPSNQWMPTCPSRDLLYFGTMVQRIVLSLVLVCFVFSPAFGLQEPIPLRTIVSWRQSIPQPDNLTKAYQTTNLTQLADVQLLHYTDEKSWLDAYAKLRQHPAVAAVQFDYAVEFRREPNDVFFDRQNNLERAGFTQVWNENTGGQTPAGEQVVIAILDAGFFTDHIDVAENLWINPAEIPDDGIDNDGNGHTDDVHGWNFVRDNHDFTPDQHGTQVMGMLGARGNNEFGVSGTGWDNRVMLFPILEVSHIISAYDYIVNQRREWQASGGTRGALVVATNASFGLQGRQCSEFPVWADMYDRLGQQGILTAASTANRSWDVDAFGDMPTTCTSDFLIGVANASEEDRLYRTSGYGTQSVDLAAPGQGSYTTLLANNFGSFSSTSAAAPYVTGAIALLYSLPCDRMQQLVRTDPAAAARLVRRSILQSVVRSDAYFNLLVTEGQLNVWNAWQRLKGDCAMLGNGNLQITRIYPNPARTTTQLLFNDPSLGPYTVQLIDAAGREVRLFHLPVGSGFPIENELNLQGVPRGAYLLRVVNEVGRSSIGKLVIH